MSQLNFGQSLNISDAPKMADRVCDVAYLVSFTFVMFLSFGSDGDDINSPRLSRRILCDTQDNEQKIGIPGRSPTIL